LGGGQVRDLGQTALEGDAQLLIVGFGGGDFVLEPRHLGHQLGGVLFLRLLLADLLGCLVAPGQTFLHGRLGGAALQVER
jgi:hypothetical protein